MKLLRRIMILLLAAPLLACAHSPALRAPTPSPLILISIDGFRPDYLDRGVTPNMTRLGAEGVRGAMRPSFPSKTYPNHYTLVTGLRPDRHGIVDNTMEDPLIPGARFQLSDRVQVRDARWWNDAKPIWVSAEEAGIKTAPMFWPGAEAAIRGVRPSFDLPFEMSTHANARVDQVLEWLDLPTDERPGFLTLYFDEVDTAGHRHGPDAPATNEAIARTDMAVRRLLQGLASRGLAADVVIVADHGMAQVRADRVIMLEDLVEPGLGRPMSLGAFMSYVPAPDRISQAETALLSPHPHVTCWRKDEIPKRFRYGGHRRVAPIFCLAEQGWEIVATESVARRGAVTGNRGYDPSSPEMLAVFLASGPSFRRKVRTPVFDNVDIYPLLARLLDLRPEPNDGDLEALGTVLTP